VTVASDLRLQPAERVKFDLLSEGLSITPAAQRHIDRHNGDRPMTPADYASTSGVILRLDGQVWVNAPIALYNPNFVDRPGYALDLRDSRLVVEGRGLSAAAEFWLPPAYHGATNEAGEPYNSYAFTHGDRVRISPIEGCAIACQFCDLPYDFKYRRKRVAGLVDSVARAVADEVQPAGHVLISGGTPREEDYDYLQECYEAVITGFPGLAVDIMMVPMPGLLDFGWLDRIGVNELSLNIEIYDPALSRRIMRRKSEMTQQYYLDVIEQAAGVLGPGRVRSMLLVGIEPQESTLAAVEAIVDRGGVPVLSPFRPDPGTPMRKAPPPTAAELAGTYLRAADTARARGGELGPSCLPCGHNTLSFSASGIGASERSFAEPRLV
jgi:radical SAM superfamily enzyme YgiQ (UPF0313 family)